MRFELRLMSASRPTAHDAQVLWPLVVYTIGRLWSTSLAGCGLHWQVVAYIIDRLRPTSLTGCGLHWQVVAYIIGRLWPTSLAGCYNLLNLIEKLQ